jgi:AcrR family transcriptional regulator
MIDAAVRQVQDGGFTMAMTRLQMDETIKAAGVPRASAYRAWAHKDDFVLDVLEKLGRDSADGLAPHETFNICLAVVADNHELLETEEGRRTVLVSLIKESVQHSLRGSVASAEWKQFVALSMAVADDIPADTRERLVAALAAGSHQLNVQMATFHRAFTELLGYKMKVSYEENWELYALLCSSSIDGLGLHAMATDDSLQSVHTWPECLGKGGTAAAVAQLALFDAFMERDPHYRPTRALQAVHGPAAG